MTKGLLWRGMLAGVLAAVLATLFARIFAEPQVDLAIGFEAAHSAHHMADGPELVSRAVQKSAGLLTAMALYGAAIGGLFALVFAYGYGRIARIGPRSFALWLAVLGFVVVALVPALKYPPTPPAVGLHETVGFRTAAYFAMIALSLVAAVIAFTVRRAVAGSRGAFDAALIGITAYVVVVAVAQLALPAIDEVPGDFPAGVLWAFRVSALGMQAVLWATLGLAFGGMADRVLRRPGRG